MRKACSDQAGRVDRRRPLRIALILVLATLSVFSPVLGMEFLTWDDDINVYQNPLLNPPAPAGLAHFWTGPHQNLYVPLTYTVWMGLAWFSRLPDGGLHPGLFHGANLTLHVAAVLVVFALLRLLVREDWAAGAGALLFAVHPVQVEPVAWVTGLKDVLGGLLLLTAVWLYLRANAQGMGDGGWGMGTGPHPPSPIPCGSGSASILARSSPATSAAWFAKSTP